MFDCHVCGKTERRQELMREVFDIDGRPVRVEQIPHLSALTAADRCSVETPRNEFVAWCTARRTRSDPFKWTYFPTSNPKPKF